MPSHRFRTCALLASAFALVSDVGCTGGTSGSQDSGDGQGDGSDVPGAAGSDGQVCEVPDDGWAVAPMRRLTAAEYDYAVADLLGETRHVAADTLDADEAISGFAANTQVTVGGGDAEKLANVARAVAEDAVTRLNEVLKCASGQSNEACALSFIERFTRRAYRRKATSDELGILNQLYKDKAAATDHTQGVRLAIEAVLQQAPFLYRPIIGAKTPKDGVNKLTGEELASRMSFFFWSSVPDDELLDAADDGQLDTVEGLKSHAERMMKDPRFDRTLQSFALQWLGLGNEPQKDDIAYPAFNTEVWRSAKSSVAQFFSYVVKETDGSLENLFTSPVVFADQQLATTYGMTVKANGFEKTATDPKRRGGVFMQAAVLANLAGTEESSPVKRGVFVRSKLLCQSPPPPPANGVAAIAPASPDKTQRQRLEEHRKNPTCAACHAFFDPLGLAFEHFDGVGAYREKEHGLAIDSSGDLTESDVDGPFADGVELMSRLQGSQVVAECLTTQFYRFAVGRLESPADACVLKRLTASMMGQGYSVREVFTKVATSDAFRFVGRI
ncbi:MAG: DUF1592 domain-containing protein [Deltaproteobacteria bacterium]|nr:DUF1592 domain-containing protein [Deltaproteobacteria bacterium]